MPDERTDDLGLPLPEPSLPEIARSMRGLGSGRSRHPDEAERFFTPFLAARRRAASARTRGETAQAFDATTLGAALDRYVGGIATARTAGRPAAAQRALAAELDDVLAPLRQAVAALGTSDEALRGHEGNDELWGRWLAALQAVFAAADRTWSALDARIDSLPSAPAARPKPGGSAR